MTSRPASAARSESLPRNTMPVALPLTQSKSTANTPRVLSPNPEVMAITEALEDAKLNEGDEKATTAEFAEGPAMTTAPPVSSVHIPIVVNEAGSPTRQEIQVRGEDDVFETATSAPAFMAPNPAFQQVMHVRGPTTNSYGFAPRPDRLSQAPTAANAQGIFPPEALIFVANLSMHKSEEQLDVSVHEAFDYFGPNHVKVHRDRNRHPYAFVQYEIIQDAVAAVKGAYGLVLDGRKVRVEHAKAERAVILSKLDGSPVSEAEARGILERFGSLELVAAATTPNRRDGGMTNAMYVRFAYYLDCRDALRQFDNHRNTYQLFMAPSLEPRIRVNPDGNAVVRGFQQPRSAIDVKSIYVGNLPEGVSKEELAEYFSAFGNVLNVNTMRKIYEGTIVNNFAFIEFTHEHEAMQAAGGERYFKGVKLRVEAKEYSVRHQARVVPSGVVAPLVTESNAAFNGRARYDGGGGRQMYSHGHPAVAANAYAQHMTPPTAMQNINAYGTPMQAPPGFAMMTPPSHHGGYMPLNQMLPAGIFSPPPTNAQYGYQGVPFGVAPAMYGGVPMIEESGEDAHF
ncbi:hypothetical protein H2200_010255 [Cladophialophora chaetospira]|uniref:RRM domain-containing protein n=1 Tax=Cladophialophora chaetospira TaxID=386627 RepID=A0AA38X2G0_9EURO|nr:hypothetical protein H2200_010255 [Cladophialophora chaetospira]